MGDFQVEHRWIFGDGKVARLEVRVLGIRSEEIFMSEPLLRENLDGEQEGQKKETGLSEEIFQLYAMALWFERGAGSKYPLKLRPNFFVHAS